MSLIAMKTKKREQFVALHLTTTRWRITLVAMQI